MITRCLLIAGLLFCTLSAHAETDYKLNEYVDFAVRWTSYKYNGEALPQIKKVRSDIVQIYAYGDYEFAQAEYKGIQLPTVLAIYDPKGKKILVSEKIQDNDPTLTATLVHEMVHYLQDINGYTASLDGRIVCTESEAYDVQMLWQLENKINLQEIPYIQERSLLSAMKCMGNMFDSIPSAKSRYDQQ